MNEMDIIQELNTDLVILFCLFVLMIIGGLSGYELDKRYNQQSENL